MKYLALVYADEERWNALSDAERQAVYARYRAFAQESGRSGKVVDGAELAPVSAATTVRVRDGQTLVSDGPFAETKEALGGYFVLDCESMADAVALAARVPAAEHGAVEVRAAYTEGAA